mmetsp:Transcript_44859/g.104575  ORF Transcript_44859/g.104575 Transcript_44859/m.104575 type:complete len:206 (-) Transcript_44859:19-636(-)
MALARPTLPAMTAVKIHRPNEFRDVFFPAWQKTEARPVASRAPQKIWVGQASTRPINAGCKGPEQTAAAPAVAASCRLRIPYTLRMKPKRTFSGLIPCKPKERLKSSALELVPMWMPAGSPPLLGRCVVVASTCGVRLGLVVGDEASPPFPDDVGGSHPQSQRILTVGPGVLLRRELVKRGRGGGGGGATSAPMSIMNNGAAKEN